MKVEDILIHEEEHLFTSSPDENACEKDALLHEESMNMWEMANLHPEDTGLLNLIVWTSGGGEKLQHGPRIKVVKGNKYRPELSSTVPLYGKPKIIGNANLSQNDFTCLVKWINLNKSAILKYWNDEVTTHEFISLIKKI